MNEDQLADILAQHLDALLEGSPLPEGLPAEVAELLAVAQNLTEAAPTSRPEFGLALKESLLGPTSGGNGPVDPTSSTGATGPAFASPMVLIIVVSLVGLAVVLTLLIGAVIFGVTQSTLFGSPSSPTRPVQTEVIPTQSNPSPTPAAPTLMPTAPNHLDPTSSPAPTATAILDILPPITVTIEVSPPPGLVPGPSGDSGGNDGSGSSGGGDNGGGGANDDGGGGGDD
jgi:hypothetical protein